MRLILETLRYTIFWMFIVNFIWAECFAVLTMIKNYGWHGILPWQLCCAEQLNDILFRWNNLYVMIVIILLQRISPPWWRHQMETFSALLAICAGNSPGTKASDAELWCIFLICVWINGWVNNREADDLRRYRAHYDITVMTSCRSASYPRWLLGSRAAIYRT